MYCYQCGTEIANGAKFCSGCGRAIEEHTPAQRTRPRDMTTHVQILAWLFIGSAVLYGLLGVILMVAPKILETIPIPIPPDVPFDVVQFVSAISGILGVSIIVVAAGSAAAGVGLLQYQTWGRTLALVMAAVMLIKIPFGTAIGIYAFWVLLSQRGREHFDAMAARA